MRDLFGSPVAPPWLLPVARRYAASRNWRVRQLVTRPDLTGESSWSAVFVDTQGVEHERTAADLAPLRECAA